MKAAKFLKAENSDDEENSELEEHGADGSLNENDDSDNGIENDDADDAEEEMSDAVADDEHVLNQSKKIMAETSLGGGVKPITLAKPKAAATSVGKKVSTQTMVDAAIIALSERGGSSLVAIKQYIISNYATGDEKRLGTSIKKYIKEAITDGRMVQVKRSFKLTTKAVKKTQQKEKKIEKEKAKKGMEKERDQKRELEHKKQKKVKESKQKATENKPKVGKKNDKTESKKKEEKENNDKENKEKDLVAKEKDKVTKGEDKINKEKEKINKEKENKENKKGKQNKTKSKPAVTDPLKEPMLQADENVPLPKKELSVAIMRAAEKPTTSAKKLTPRKSIGTLILPAKRTAKKTNSKTTNEPATSRVTENAAATAKKTRKK